MYSIIDYYCRLDRDGQWCVRIGARYMKLCPLTFTTQECLEDGGAEMGWRYVSHKGGLPTGILTIEVSMYEDIDTITYMRYGE